MIWKSAVFIPRHLRVVRIRSRHCWIRGCPCTQHRDLGSARESFHQLSCHCPTRERMDSFIISHVNTNLYMHEVKLHHRNVIYRWKVRKWKILLSTGKSNKFLLFLFKLDASFCVTNHHDTVSRHKVRTYFENGIHFKVAREIVLNFNENFWKYFLSNFLSSHSLRENLFLKSHHLHRDSWIALEELGVVKNHPRLNYSFKSADLVQIN